MIAATIYNIETGLIERTVVVPDSDVQANCGEGEAWVQGTYSPDCYIVQNGVLLDLPKRPPHPTTLDLTTLTWVDDDNRIWSQLRHLRSIKLKQSDWTQVPDAPVDHQAWAEYRQALRDLPANTTDPRNPNWPTTP